MTTKAFNKIDIKTATKLVWQHRELFFWIAALIMLYTADMHSDFTLCVPSNLGFKNCPGCGLGHSITAIMHGDIMLSWQYHVLGIPALFILLLHIGKLTKRFITNIKITYYGQ